MAACAASEPPVRTAAAEQIGGAAPVPVILVGGSSVGNYLVGRYAQKVYDYKTASQHLERVLRRDPGNRELLRRTFRAMLAEGRLDDAVKLAYRLVKHEPKAPLANLAISAGLMKQGKFAAADARLRKLSRTGLANFMVPLGRAWALAGRGKTDNALAALKPLSKMTGFSVLYELHSGLINELSGRMAAAEAHYLKAAKGASRSTLRVVEALGAFYERSGRAAEAAKIYRRYISENPDSLVLQPSLDRVKSGGKPALIVPSARDGMAEAYFNLAGTLTQENSILTALVFGRLALGLRPDFPVAQMLVGRILEMLDRHRDAIAVYSAVAKDSPLNWSARLRVASSLESLGEDDEAVRRLRIMSREKGARADALIVLGDLLRSKKQFRESVKAYDAAIRKIPRFRKRHWTLLYSRGISLERSKQWARAEKDFVAALKLNPDQPYVLNYLGYSWVDQGINLSRAQKMIERAVRLKPNDGYIVDSLGWVLFRIGKFPDAVKQLERAVEMRPQDPTINDHLGDAYWRVGRINEARFQWRRALSLEPEQEQVPIIKRKISEGLQSASSNRKGI